MSRSSTVARVALASVVALLPAAGIVVAAAVLGPQLGTTMASHWSGPGRADGFTPTWSAFRAFTAITGAFMVATLITAVLAARQRVPRTVPAIIAAFAGFTAAAWVAAAWATADAASPDDARLGARLLILLPALACGAVIYLLLPPPVPPTSPTARRPSLPIDAQDRISWSGVTGSRVLGFTAAGAGLLFVGSIALAVVLRQGGLWTAVVVLGSVTLLGLALTRVRLTIDRRGIRVISVPLRVLLIRIRLENVESVTADTIEPTQWGGWGFRVSASGLAYVARRGPGLIVSRRAGTAFAITIDRPEEPAAVANALIARIAGRSS